MTHGNLYPAIYLAFVLVTDGNVDAGIAGVQFGINYGSGRSDGMGVDVFSWTVCATQEFQQLSPVWPESGGGNRVTWDPITVCQRYFPPGNDPANGVCTNAGYLYLTAYGPADIHITPRPSDGLAKVVSCAGEEDIVEGAGVVRTPAHLGSCGFGTEPGNSHPGYNPCGLNTPVEATTWSAVKSLYR